MSDRNRPGALRRELTGKAKRVVGVFVFMAGAGIVLDSPAIWVGAAIMLGGVAAFLWGIADTRVREGLALHEHDSHPSAAATRPTEGHL